MSSERVFNFSAGPSALPLECLEQAAAELTNWNHTGMSVIEHSHRGKAWTAENEDVRNRLRNLVGIPENFEICFVAGGASLQFSALPYNFIGDHKKVDFLITGNWSKKAYEECKRLFPNIEVNQVAPAPPANPIDIPDKSTWKIDPDAAYLHICDNETIQGIEFPQLPDVPIPLVIDMSSNFLSKPITEWNKIGCIFACAQKNFGPAGMTVVIVRKDLLERPLLPGCPITLDLRTQVKNKCLYNTPPQFCIYFANLVFKWIEKKGGLKALAEINAKKAAQVYEAIDKSPYFVNKVKPEYRSKMNVPFFRAGNPDGYEVKNQELDDKFLKFTTDRKLLTLKGHVSVGGFRASIYNAMTQEGIDALCKAVAEFPGF